MAVAAWSAWGEEWGLYEKVSFNGYTNEITVNSGVSALSIRDDVYSAWVRWTDREPQFFAAMRFTGLDPIPGGETGGTFFLINGWKLVYDPRVVAVSGILYSDDYDTAYYFTDGSAVYPAVVSALSLSGSSAPIDYAALAAAVAAQFAEPSMTTAGIAAATSSAIGTVDVDPIGIADEVESRFLFGPDGRVFADIDGSEGSKQLQRAVTAAIPSPTSAATIWEAAPAHLLKEIKQKDFSKEIKAIAAKIDAITAGLGAREQEAAQIDLSPVVEAIRSGDKEFADKANEIIARIDGIQVPDSTQAIDDVRSAVAGVAADIVDLGLDLVGVRNAISAIPEPDLTQLATRDELEALKGIASKLANYDDAQIRRMLESLVANTEALPDDAERISRKVDLLLDNQLRLL